jgi:hypothetical protein
MRLCAYVDCACSSSHGRGRINTWVVSEEQISGGGGEMEYGRKEERKKDNFTERQIAIMERKKGFQ